MNKATTPEQLFDHLTARELLAADAKFVAAKTAEDIHDKPWFINLILGFSAWLAAIFLMVSLFLILRSNQNGGTYLFIGIMLIVAARGFIHIDRSGAFFSQLALAFSLCGQVAVVFGFSEIIFGNRHVKANDMAVIAFIAFALQIAMLIIMPPRLHRMIATVFAVVIWAFAIRLALGLVHDKYDDAGKLATDNLARVLASWIIVWLPVVAVIWAAIRNESSVMARGWQPLVRPMLIGLIASLAIATLFTHPLESLNFVKARSPERAQDWLALWPLLSVIAALGALVAAFAIRNTALIGLTVIAALIHISHFYYAMGVSLLIKSITMMVLGVACFMIARLLKTQLVHLESAKQKLQGQQS